MGNKVAEESAEVSAKKVSLRLWLGFACVGLLVAALYFLPYILEKVLYKQLQGIGYQQIELTHVEWSNFGRGFQFQHLQASGEGLPNVLMGKTNMWLKPAKLLDAALELQLNSIVFDGHITLFIASHLWSGRSKVTAQLADFSISKLVAATPHVKSYFPTQIVDQSIEGQFSLEVTGLWSNKLQVMPTIHADIMVKNLQLPASANQPVISAEAVEIKQLQYSPAGKSPARIQIGDIIINQFKTPNMATQTGAQIFPFSMAKLHVTKLEMIADHLVSIGGLSVLGAQAGIDSKPLAVVGDLKVQTIQWQEDKRLSLASIVLNKGEMIAEMDTMGQLSDWQLWLAALSLTAEEGGEKSDGNKKIESAEETHPVSIQKIVIQAFKVKFADQSKTPVVRLPMEIQSLVAEDVMLAKDAEPIAWKAHGLLGVQGQWKADGVFTPFSLEQATNGKLHIEGLELSPLSGYFAQSYGKGIRSGNLDINLSILVEQGLLKAEGDLFARKVSFSDIKGAVSSSGTMMPLDTALDVLKDGDDNITLQFSSEGKLDDPSFKLSGVWDKVLSKAASTSAVFMLAQLIQPYALVLTAGEFLYDQFKHISLKPIVFVQGDATGADAQPDMEVYAKKIAGLLSKKTSLLLEICPRYSLEEKETGEMLSRARSQLLSGYLQQLDVPTNRVTNCLPELDEGKKAKSRLELTLI